MQQKLRTLNLESGQALLIVVLVMVIALTVGLSVASRTIVHIRTTTDEANSQKAFSAAEAGVERALKLGPTPITDFSLGEGANIQNVTIHPVGGDVAEVSLNNGNPILQDDGVDVWLVDHDSDNNIDYSSGWRKEKEEGDTAHTLTFYWGPSSDQCAADADKIAAIELIVLTKDRGNDPIQSTRYALDPCSTRAGNNKFAYPGLSPLPSGVNSFSNTASSSPLGEDFAYNATITIPVASNNKKSKGILIRVVPLYAQTIIHAEGSIDLPEQGKIIESIGEAGGAVRKVVYYKGYRKLPSEFFQNVLFSH